MKNRLLLIILFLTNAASSAVLDTAAINYLYSLETRGSISREYLLTQINSGKVSFDAERLADLKVFKGYSYSYRVEQDTSGYFDSNESVFTLIIYLNSFIRIADSTTTYQLSSNPINTDTIRLSIFRRTDGKYSHFYLSGNMSNKGVYFLMSCYRNDANARELSECLLNCVNVKYDYHARNFKLVSKSENEYVYENDKYRVIVKITKSGTSLFDNYTLIEKDGWSSLMPSYFKYKSARDAQELNVLVCNWLEYISVMIKAWKSQFYFLFSF